jgi:hypothetical protein
MCIISEKNMSEDCLEQVILMQADTNSICEFRG